MLRRLWLLLSLPWFAFCLWGYNTGPRPMDGLEFLIAVFPLLAGLALFYGSRFVVSGRITKPRVILYRGPRP